MLPSFGRAPLHVLTGPQWHLHDIVATRALETAALSAAPPHVLMQRAGLACARLALAIAPHARAIWVAAGPGNNGGDGMEAAMHLQRWGCRVTVTCLADPAAASSDASASRARAANAGVTFAAQPPLRWDLCIDALLGIGATRSPDGVMAQWIHHMQVCDAPVLAVDNPTGLNADTGDAAAVCVRASATLCLLTLKPGLFTADGRDMAGQVWLDDLQHECAVLPATGAPTAFLLARPADGSRRHASHKGSYGDVAVVGGASGLTGAALLAATASLYAGAGRVFLCPLDPHAASLASAPAELMLRELGAMSFERMTVVCGCGGGDAIRAQLPTVLSRARTLVLDADALNALAIDSQLQQLLVARSQRAAATVLTPHPLEAGRLLGITAAQVQVNRIDAAHRIAARFKCVVVLKGSGTVVAAPDHLPAINPTGNALLATAGSGDVLAGMIGAKLAAGMPAFEAACAAVFAHGEAADHWPTGTPLTAGALARALR